MNFYVLRCLIASFILFLCITPTITAQLKVLSPDGGERFTSGDIVPILWTGIPVTTPVSIEFSTDDGTTWSVIEQNTIGGRFLWSVPDMETSDKCLIRVSTQGTVDELNPKFVRAFQGNFQGLHKGANSVDISPGNKYIVSAGANGEIVLWNMHSGQQLWRRKGHDRPIILIRFNFDGSLIATESVDGTAIIWNTETGNVKHILRGGRGIMWSVGFSPDGKILATANDDGTITKWNVETGNEIETFEVHSEGVRFLEYTQDGSKIISCSVDRGASINDAETGKRIFSVVHTFAALGGSRVITNGVQLTHDGSVLITSGYDGWVRFWSTHTGQLITEKRYHGGAEASELQISPNGQWMMSVGYDGTTKIVNPHTGEIFVDIDPDMEGMIRAKFSSDNRYVAISHFDGKATLWELSTQTFDVSDSMWTIEYCDTELTGIEEQNQRSSFSSHLDLKARP